MSLESEGYMEDPSLENAKQLILEAQSKDGFSQKMCSYYGLNTPAHEHVIKELIIKSIFTLDFWVKSCGNGVVLTNELRKYTNLTFATSFDYMSAGGPKRYYILQTLCIFNVYRREGPLDMDLSTKLKNVSDATMGGKTVRLVKSEPCLSIAKIGLETPLPMFTQSLSSINPFVLGSMQTPFRRERLPTVCEETSVPKKIKIEHQLT